MFDRVTGSKLYRFDSKVDTKPFVSIDLLLLRRVYVRTSDSREGWLPMSILMQTALSEDSAAGHKPEDSHFRRE